MQDMHCNASMPKAWKYRKCCFFQKSCIDFKKFIETTVDHCDTGYYKEVICAAKNFVKRMEMAEMCVRAWRQHKLHKKKKKTKT